MKFKTVIDEILNDVAPLKRLSTQGRYDVYLGDMKNDLGDRDLNTFSRRDFMEWIKTLKKRKPKRETFNDYTKFINIVFNFSYQNKYITHKIKFPQIDGERDKAGRVYSDDEIKTLIPFMNKNLLLQFVLSYECFMRLREFLHLTWDRVDFERGVIILRKQDVKTGTKCNQGRDVPLSENAARMLSSLKAMSDSKWVFPNPKKTNHVDSNKKSWNKVKALSGITGRARWHDIRHSAISHAVMIKKLPIAHISKIAGVSMRTIEKVYLHHNVDQVRFVVDQMNILKIA